MILLLDNYDSFVHNLARYLRQIGTETRVVRSDAIDVAGVAALSPQAIVLSPGPKRPVEAGCCVDVVRQLGNQIPILGICLGHQAIGEAMGAEIVTCKPAHGIAATIRHNDSELFRLCENPMNVGRYHSLAIDPATVPKTLQVTSKTDDGVIMSVQHRSDPVYGVQYHPESILSDCGMQLLRNFMQLTEQFHAGRSTQVVA